MARANAVVETTPVMDGARVVGMKFEVKGQGETTLLYANVPQSVREVAMIQGFKTRISNAAALSRDTATGQSATPADKWAGVRKLAEHYNSGAAEWNIARGAAEARGPSDDVLMIVRAIAEVQGVEYERMLTLAQKRVETTKSTLKVWAASMESSDSELGERIRGEVARMKAARPSKVNAADELAATMDGLDGDDDAQDNNGDNGEDES
jgi:hypothetical protein